MQSTSRRTQVWLTSSLGFVHTASSTFNCPVKGNTIPSLPKKCFTTLPAGQICQLCWPCNCSPSISSKAWNVETHCHVRGKKKKGRSRRGLELKNWSILYYESLHVTTILQKVSSIHRFPWSTCLARCSAHEVDLPSYLAWQDKGLSWQNSCEEALLCPSFHMKRWCIHFRAELHSISKDLQTLKISWIHQLLVKSA